MRLFAPPTVVALLAVCSAASYGQERDLRSPFAEIMTLRDAKSARVSSYDRSGGNHDWIDIAPGQTAVLADITGAGCVKHFYWAYIIADEDVRKTMLRDCILRMWWDGEETPSVEAPIGDFSGMGNCQLRRLNSLVLVANPGANADPGTWGMNCYFPMPFSRSARIELRNDGAHPVGVWYHIDYEAYGDKPAGLDDLGRFHAQFRRSNPTPVRPGAGATNLTGDDNYVILDARGHGNLAGYVLNVDNLVGGWWGEGDDMVFIDGETWPPSLHGTGTEEIFGGGACPNVEYSGPYTGFHMIENRGGDAYYGKNSMYRFFVNDPIRFRESIRATIEHGHANDLANDYSSVAYWYQREPHAPFPELPSREQRAPITQHPRDVGVEGAIEVEAEIPKARTSGQALLPLRLAGAWSRGAMAVLMSHAPGDFVAFRETMRETGTYRVVLYYAAANDLGSVQLSIDGEPVGAPVDAYNGGEGAGPTRVIGPLRAYLGERSLTAGEHEFRLEIVGRNPASRGYVMAIDCIALVPAK